MARGAAIPVKTKFHNGEWRKMSVGQRIEGLLGMSLDDALQVLQWPMDEAAENPHKLSAKMQVIRVVLTVSAKVGLEANRERVSLKAIEALAERLIKTHEHAQAQSPIHAPSDGTDYGTPSTDEPER